MFSHNKIENFEKEMPSSRWCLTYKRGEGWEVGSLRSKAQQKHGRASRCIHVPEYFSSEFGR